MALPSVALAALFLMLAAHFDISTCDLVKGSVSCLDCAPHYDFSGVRVAIECNHERSSVSASTNDKGYFEAKIPSSSSRPPSSLECIVTLLGGPEQLCSFKKSMVSKVVKAQGSNYYTLSTPLTVLSSCHSKFEHPKPEKPEKATGLGSSKTIDLPLPKEWGLAPSSYYLPFIPIIGVP